MEQLFIPIVVALGAIGAVARFYLLSKRSRSEEQEDDEPQDTNAVETFKTNRDEMTWRRAYSRLS